MWLWWFFVDMPRFRRRYLREMKHRFPDQYASACWPARWQDKVYARVSGSSHVA